MAKYSQENLKLMSEQVLHAYNNPQNIYHEEVKIRLQWMSMVCRMSIEEIMERVEEMSK